MRKSIIFMVFLAFIGVSKAQENKLEFKEGTILTLGQSSAARYQHIDFPRKNFIIKRGAIANFNALIGEKLVLQEILKNENGRTRVILRRNNGKNFFRFYPTIVADLEKAITYGELNIYAPRAN